MSSETEICNMALSHIGVGKEIANLDTERSQEASACRRYYENLRDKVLRDFRWPFATKFVELALIEETPTIEWRFSYRYPTDCVKMIRILSGGNPSVASTNVNLIFRSSPNSITALTSKNIIQQDNFTSLNFTRNDTRQSRVPYRILKDDSGLILYTDMINAQAEYIERVTDPSFYPPDFELAFSYLLAAHIAPRLTGGDPFKMRGEALQLYLNIINKAKVHALNEQQDDINPDSERILARQ